MTEQENVIPLEIKGSITVYPQSYVNKLNEKLAQAKELLKEWAYNYGHVNELLEQKSLSFINKE